jgi:hypothetical protein
MEESIREWGPTNGRRTCTYRSGADSSNCATVVAVLKKYTYQGAIPTESHAARLLSAKIEMSSGECLPEPGEETSPLVSIADRLP